MLQIFFPDPGGDIQLFPNKIAKLFLGCCFLSFLFKLWILVNLTSVILSLWNNLMVCIHLEITVIKLFRNEIIFFVADDAISHRSAVLFFLLKLVFEQTYINIRKQFIVLSSFKNCFKTVS